MFDITHVKDIFGKNWKVFDNKKMKTFLKKKQTKNSWLATCNTPALI